MDMVTISQFLVLGFGIKEIQSAVEYHRQQKRNWAIASFCIGIFACGCGIISMTGIL